MSSLRAVKGMHDILPEEGAAFRYVEETYRTITHRYGYSEVRTPIVEPTGLFVRGIGDATDIVEKEMYTFKDKGDHSLTLRPEGTASAARAFIQHTVYARSPVTKWTYVGPMYRRERPAKGRTRQFHQLGAEVFGDAGPHSDAELIEMLTRFLTAVGVTDIEVLVNSLGSGDTRERYREALVEFLSPHREKLSADSQRRLDRNPLRVLDSKAPEDQAIAADAPDILGFLGDDDRGHFDGLQQGLEALGVSYRVEPRLVRGLDYYTRTLFEVKGRGGDLGAQDTICGGGRYDRLVETLGGPATPGIGFAVGIERVMLCLGERPTADAPDAVIVTMDANLRNDVLRIAQELRTGGLAVEADLRGTSLKSQMRRADKSGAAVALVLGGDEVARGVVQVKPLRDADAPQREVARADLLETLRANR